MIEDKIALAIKDLKKLKDELKEIKKDIKVEERIDEESYVELKKAYKDMKAQVKGFEEKWMQELAKDPAYAQLREMKVKKEEAIAEKNAELFKFIGELPQKLFQISIETENGPVKIQIQPEMRLYFNGKEEKKRTA